MIEFYIPKFSSLYFIVIPLVFGLPSIGAWIKDTISSIWNFFFGIVKEKDVERGTFVSGHETQTHKTKGWFWKVSDSVSKGHEKIVDSVEGLFSTIFEPFLRKVEEDFIPVKKWLPGLSWWVSTKYNTCDLWWRKTTQEYFKPLSEGWYVMKDAFDDFAQPIKDTIESLFVVKEAKLFENLEKIRKGLMANPYLPFGEKKRLSSVLDDVGKRTAKVDAKGVYRAMTTEPEKAVDVEKATDASLEPAGEEFSKLTETFLWNYIADAQDLLSVWGERGEGSLSRIIGDCVKMVNSESDFFMKAGKWLWDNPYWQKVATGTEVPVLKVRSHLEFLRL